LKLLLGDCWLPLIEPIARYFGDISLRNTLVVSSVGAEQGLKYIPKVSLILGMPACPIGYTGYMSSDGGCLWVDELGRCYAQDDEGILFLAYNFERLLSVILLKAPRDEPPPELREILERAYRW